MGETIVYIHVKYKYYKNIVDVPVTTAVSAVKEVERLWDCD